MAENGRAGAVFYVSVIPTLLVPGQLRSAPRHYSSDHTNKNYNTNIKKHSSSAQSCFTDICPETALHQSPDNDRTWIQLKKIIKVRLNFKKTHPIILALITPSSGIVSGSSSKYSLNFS